MALSSFCRTLLSHCPVALPRMSCLQATAWFEYLGFAGVSASPVTFCSSAVLGDILSTHSTDVVQHSTLHALWATQGQAWQQCPPPRTPPSPTPASAAHKKRGQKPAAGAAVVRAEEGSCDAALSTDCGSQNSPDAMHAGSHMGVADSYPSVPILQLPSRGRSGNLFASLQSSLDDTRPVDAAAAAFPPAAVGAVVPPLALHRLPAPFGNALGGQSSQPMQSRFAQASSMVLASSFTSASLSYSEVTSTGYTTRSPSPDAGLRSHFLHAAMPHQEEYGDAVSNPLFGCSPKRGNSPGKLVEC